MNEIDIDALYEAFCGRLPVEIREVAGELAFRLNLVPNVHVPWSGVFKNAVTLHAPWLCADSMTHVSKNSIERAVFAHMLAVIEAFGSDRIADRQATDTPELRRVLTSLRDARDEALEVLGGSNCVQMARDADVRTQNAIATERKTLLTDDPVSFEEYEYVSAGKQAVGLPGTLALAQAAGWNPEKLDTVRSTLMGIWLGLQFQDDVVDWEEDSTRGGAWAVLLARHRLRPTPQRNDGVALRQLVHSSGVLADMLGLALDQYRIALSGAERLGSERLAAWLRERVAEGVDYHAGERESPGYLSRLKRLAPWYAEVTP